jgi:protein TonB
METQTLRPGAIGPFSLPHVSSQRFVGIGFVVLLHVALIYALISMKVIPVDIFVPPDDITVVTLPPPVTPPVQPPATKVVTPTVVVVPPIWIDESQPRETITPPPPQPPTTVASSPATAAQSIARTITRPPYPPIEKRLGHEGTVSLRLMISADGTVTDAIVTRSSGYPALDAAAVAWITSHWRYRPATRDGKPVTSQANANMKFELVN